MQPHEWRVEWCLWMFMCICVGICQVFMKKGPRRVKGERESDKCLVIPWAFSLFKLSPYFSSFLVLLVFSFCLPILLVYPHGLLQSIVHIFILSPCSLYALWSTFCGKLSSFFQLLAKRILLKNFCASWRLSDTHTCPFTSKNTCFFHSFPSLRVYHAHVRSALRAGGSIKGGGQQRTRSDW